MWLTITSNWIVHLIQKHWAPDLEEDDAERMVSGTKGKFYYFITCFGTPTLCSYRNLLLTPLNSRPMNSSFSLLFVTSIWTSSQRSEWWKISWKPKRRLLNLEPTERSPGREFKGSINLNWKEKFHHLFSLTYNWNLVFCSNINAGTKTQYY